MEERGLQNVIEQPKQIEVNNTDDLSKIDNVMDLTITNKLTKSQIKLLSKGLTFIPTVTSASKMKGEFKNDLKRYHRKIKLALYFEEEEEERTVEKFVYPSDWTPPLHNLPPELDILINKDLNFIDKEYKLLKELNNLSIEEKRALKDLKTNKQIIIKPADKGSMVVIMERAHYIKEVERQLKDTEYYKKLDYPIYLDTIPMIKSIIDSMIDKKVITKKQGIYLQGPPIPRERRFYILPKIHKEPEKWTIPFLIPPGRPIVSDCGSETYHTADFIEHFLHPLSIQHPAYIKDTYHFTQIIKTLTIPHKSFFFFTMDVSNLYTNIVIEKGLKTVKKFLKKYPEENRPDEELLQLLDINLNRNDFEFNGDYYLQIKGTAMGKKFAPSYANIFMADWEEAALKECPTKPLCYYRYLDDIFGIWVGSERQFQEFINILNNQDKSIQLSVVIGQDQIDFLDTTIYIGPKFLHNKQLDIKVHFKKTDKHTLLFKNSFHPKHTHKGLIKSQLIRYKRICTQQNDFSIAVKILFQALRKRGYSRTFLRHCSKKFEQETHKTHKTHNKLLPLITKYSTSTNKATSRIMEHFKEEIQQKGLLTEYKIIRAFSKHRNLKDILTKAKLTDNTQIQSDDTPTLIHLSKIQNTRDNTFYGIHQSFSLRSKNCIFTIQCGICQKKYIGDTKDSLLELLKNLTYKISKREQNEENYIIHFNKHDWGKAKLIGLQRDINWTDKFRRDRTTIWINYLDSKMPYGLN